MADDFKKYLATEILSEQQTISYRSLARVLKVHVNVAKCMLYEFHEFQSAKKPGSIYATYLLCGTKKRPTLNVTTSGHKNGYDNDEHIPSSPPPFTSSMLEPSQQSSQAEEEEVAQVPVRTITLVREDALEELKEQYEAITSIHIYSLSPARIPDLVTLTDIGRGLFTDFFIKEDPLQHNATYGVIQNPDVRRRTGKRLVIPSGPAPKFQAVKEESKRTSTSQTKQPTTKHFTSAKNEDSSRPSSRDSTSTTTSAKPSSKPSLKRDASDLFKAFAKQGQAKKGTPISTPNAAPEDTKIKDASDEEGESEDESFFLDTNTRKPATSSSRKRPSDSKKEKDERAAKLRKLVESDDEEVAAVPNIEKAAGVESDEPVAAQKGTDEDAASKTNEDEVAWSDSDSEKKKSATNGEAGASQEPKRRRGKRKVMKKKTMKDEDGYLVTKEEVAWESFSEDEPEPAPVKKDPLKSSFGGAGAKSQSQSQGKAGAAAKKKAAGGGGNIMSFFGKKNA